MADRWEELEKRCQNCRECSLCETRTNVVFGDGSRTAEIMFVGEGPGAHEDEQGVPFVGKAGQLRDPTRRPDAFEDLMSLREKARAVCEHTPLPEKL